MKQIFYVGDEVKDPEYGDGVVNFVKTDKVRVAFQHCDDPYIKYIWFSNDGCRDGIPRLSFRDGGFSYGTPPERKWIPTEPCWAWVTQSKRLYDLKDAETLTYIVGFVTTDGPCYIDSVGDAWTYATPCDPPEYANLFGGVK